MNRLMSAPFVLIPARQTARPDETVELLQMYQR